MHKDNIINNLINDNCYNSDQNLYHRSVKILKKGIDLPITDNDIKLSVYKNDFLYFSFKQFTSVDHVLEDFSIYFETSKIWLFEDDTINMSYKDHSLNMKVKELYNSQHIAEEKTDSVHINLIDKGASRLFFESYYKNPGELFRLYRKRLYYQIKNYIDDDIEYIPESVLISRLKGSNVIKNNKIDKKMLEIFIENNNLMSFGCKNVFFYSYLTEFFELRKSNHQLKIFCQTKINNRKRELNHIMKQLEIKKGAINPLPY